MSLIAEWKIAGSFERTYTFNVYTIDSDLPATGGVYIFSERNVDAQGKGTHNILYVGQAQDISKRVTNTHEKWNKAVEKGMNAISIYPLIEDLRTIVETDLINRFKPLLNL